MTTCCSCGVSVFSRTGPRGPNTRQGRASRDAARGTFHRLARFVGDKEILNNLSAAQNSLEDRYE